MKNFLINFINEVIYSIPLCEWHSHWDVCSSQYNNGMKYYDNSLSYLLFYFICERKNPQVEGVFVPRVSYTWHLTSMSSLTKVPGKSLNVYRQQNAYIVVQWSLPLKCFVQYRDVPWPKGTHVLVDVVNVPGSVLLLHPEGKLLIILKVLPLSSCNLVYSPGRYVPRDTLTSPVYWDVSRDGPTSRFWQL